MPRVTKPLNDTQIRQAKPKDKEFSLFDGGGLLLRIKPNGAKLWLFNYYRPHLNKRANLSIGAYPDLSLARARIKRSELKQLLIQNIDPKEHRDLANAKANEVYSNTLMKVAESWLAVKKHTISQDHAIDIWRSLDLHIFPHIGSLPIQNIKARPTIDIIQTIAKRGHLETVKRLCQRLNEIMIYSVNTGLVESNPLAGIYKAFAPPIRKNMPTISPSELPKLMRDISRASIRFTTRRLIEWQLHTMVRPGEACGARWNEIDLEKRIWSIPAERMKKKRDHFVPLSDQSIEILVEMKEVSFSRKYVFPSDRDPKKHANASTANVALRRMGYGGVLVAHGLRALASTVLNEQGFDSDVIESALAHVERNDVRRAYNRALYLDRRTKLMCWWSSYIEDASKARLSLSNNVIKIMGG